MSKGIVLCIACALGAASKLARAGPFANGGFEDGTAGGGVSGEGFRGNDLNAALTPAMVLPNGALYNASAPSRSKLIANGTVDPNLGGLLGSTVYQGNYSYRAQDTVSGGFVSAISQKVSGYTDQNIFFAWKAVLRNGGHEQDESAEMMITLTDDTTHALLISRIYNAGRDEKGDDTRFSKLNDIFYTADWQIEKLSIDSALQGHDFTLSLLAADCNPTGHFGYVYLDGFAAVDPLATVPEPGTYGLIGIGAFSMFACRRRISLMPKDVPQVS
ncbi:PEP-CTERM protein-sorting domain-containing protein [Rugamonas rubra]|uniref:PEP-CTERM protein-sorting domain-containing protein n=1 Tax=Rugamonas rubra TaxID=758825 RepID=A0A1I4RFS7_9BURK|nr:PEP-CTERM protein-sorting domain-containing protein [Rugamonas rubra]